MSDGWHYFDGHAAGEEFLRLLMAQRIAEAVRASGWRKVRLVYEGGRVLYEDGTIVPEQREGVADDLDKVAVKGRVVLTRPGNNYRDCGPPGEDYRSRVLVNPTWLEVAVCVNESIAVTKNYRHVYFDCLRQEGREPGVEAVYEIEMECHP